MTDTPNPAAPTTCTEVAGGYDKPMAQLRIRIDFGLSRDRSLGPGKILLLERVRDLGSISAAARSMNMAYRRAWLLLDSLNRSFRSPVLHTHKGGSEKGGATLTPFGAELIARFRSMESAATQALAPHIAALENELAPVVVVASDD